MQANAKLELVKQACVFVLHQLQPSDKLGVIIYDNLVQELIPMTECTEANKAWMESTIEAVRTGGMTNLSGGLFGGIKQHLSDGTEASEIAGRLSCVGRLETRGAGG